MAEPKSANKANQRQSAKDRAYYERQFLRTERNKKRAEAKQERIHRRHMARMAFLKEE